MEIHDDAVQPLVRTTEVWRQRKNGGDGRDDATTYHGNVEGNGPSKTEPGGANASIVLATILKRKADGEDKGQGVLEWSPTMGIYTKGGRGFSHSVDGINLHYRSNCGEQAQES
jgi:hypothetical protein